MKNEIVEVQKEQYDQLCDKVRHTIMLLKATNIRTEALMVVMEGLVKEITFLNERLFTDMMNLENVMNSISKARIITNHDDAL